MTEPEKISRRRFLAAGGASAGLAALLPGAVGAAPGPESQTSATPAPDAAPPAPKTLPAPPGKDFYEARIAAVREMMRTAEAVALVEMPGAGLRYLTGAALERRERLVCLVLPLEEPPVLFCSEAQTEQAAAAPLGLIVQPWDEDDDPVSMVAKQLKQAGAGGKRVVMSGAARYDEFLHINGELSKSTFLSGNALVGFLRERKELDEIAVLRSAAILGRDAAEAVLKECGEGIPAGDLAARVEQKLRLAGAGGWARARFGRDTVAPELWAPERRLARGDIIVLEVIADLYGYKARVARTAILGQANGRMKLVYSHLRKAQDLMMERMKPGEPWSGVHRIGRSVLGGGGFMKMVRTLLGRGIGLDPFEPPYLAPGYHDPVAMGHVLSLEPAVYTPGEYGVEAGETLEITAAGARLMTTPPDAILELS